MVEFKIDKSTGVCCITSNCAVNLFACNKKFEQLLEIARERFPDLREEDVNCNHQSGVFSIEFSAFTDGAEQRSA